MAEWALRVLCPTCGATITVEENWRTAPCPQCGGIVMRMSDEPAYD